MKKMAAKKTKHTFSNIMKLDLIDAFQSQNWRVRQKKEGVDRELYTREEICRNVGVKDDMLDSLLIEALKEGKHKSRLAQHIAKAMFYDKVDFVKACKLYWFNHELLTPVSDLAKSELSKLVEVDNKQDANDKLRNYLGLEGEGNYAVMKYRFTGKDEVETPYEEKVKIPNKLTAIADLIDAVATDDNETKKEDRTSWAARMRTDAFEVLKIASASCKISATQFVERLILEHSSEMIRSKIGRFSEKDLNEDNNSNVSSIRFDIEAAKSMYHLLRKNYHNETTQAWFPESPSKRVPVSFGDHISKGSFWWPIYDEEDGYEEGMSRSDALEIMIKEVQGLNSRASKSAARFHTKIERANRYLEIVTNAKPDADYSALLNAYDNPMDEEENSTTEE